MKYEGKGERTIQHLHDIAGVATDESLNHRA